MELVKKFESYVKKRYAGAESKKFKFKFENTGCKRGYRVTWCPDVHQLGEWLGRSDGGRKSRVTTNKKRQQLLEKFK
jgi:hypothetical protein